MKTKTTVGSIFGILERHLFNAILRVVLPGERMTAVTIYETIWTWFIKDFEDEKAGILEAIQKGEYARKLMNPKSGKDISYHDALTLSPSLICQEGLEEAIEYCELDSKAKAHMAEDFEAIGLTVRKGYIAKDVTALLNDHIQEIIRRKKRPLARILSKIAMIMATRPITAYGLS